MRYLDFFYENRSFLFHFIHLAFFDVRGHLRTGAGHPWSDFSGCGCTRHTRTNVILEIQLMHKEHYQWKKYQPHVSYRKSLISAVLWWKYRTLLIEIAWIKTHEIWGKQAQNPLFKKLSKLHSKVRFALFETPCSYLQFPMMNINQLLNKPYVNGVKFREQNLS